MTSPKARKALHQRTLTDDGHLVISGAARVPILYAHDVIVNPGARVSGDISARRIVVNGEVHGDLRAELSIHVAGTARVRGDLMTPRLDVQTGAQLQGRIVMQGRRQSAKELDGAAVDTLLTGSAGR
jgi:cytoskeletal protein CcmA (bactofilin family)